MLRLGADAWLLTGDDDYFDGTYYDGDWRDGGTNDAVGASTLDANSGIVTYEVRHPLCSSDQRHDICITTPTSIGVYLYFYSADSLAWWIAPEGTLWPALGEHPSFVNGIQIPSSARPITLVFEP